MDTGFCDLDDIILLHAVGFDDIAIINEDDRIRRDTFTGKGEIRAKSGGEDAFSQVSGEPVNGIDLSGVFVKLVDNISEETALTGKHPIGDSGKELPFRLRESMRKFMGKIQNFSFQSIGMVE